MQSLIAHKTASLTELRDPAKVISQAGSSPVAVMNRNKCVGYFVPVEAVEKLSFEAASLDDVKAAMTKRKAATQPVLTYLQDK
jgi:antitoxin StbD